MSSLERRAIERVVALAEHAHVPIPPEVRDALERARACDGSYPARKWHELHGDEGTPVCCYGVAVEGGDRCTCWTPVFETRQDLPPLLIAPQECDTGTSLCGDCAFRPGSPERADTYLREQLYELADTGEAFYCHTGMRKPDRWVHPDGRVVDGSSDDWQPLIVAGVPYRTDGQPGLLCAGWAARHATRQARGWSDTTPPRQETTA